MTGTYIPIACAAHERLEFSVLRRRHLQLTWLSEEGHTEWSERVLPVDVETRNGAEWLTIMRPDGQSAVIRLDRIVAAIEA